MAFAGAYDGAQVCISLLSEGAVHKWYAVKVGATDGGCLECDTAGEQVLGIAQNAASAAGEYVKICVTGISKAAAQTAVTKGTSLQTAADGRLLAAASADEVCGVALEAADAAGDVITAIIGYAGIY